MSTEFNREERYIVFKLSDVEEHFTPGEMQQLARLTEVQRVGRSEAGKPLLECVVVEVDWPEYEPTWKAIEARVTGAQPSLSFADAYQGAREDLAIWKKRALKAEDLNRKFVAEINGPAYMGEPTHPAPSVPLIVGHLDLGVGGYIDIETALPDNELATLPKGRHALAIVGTYGVDGYVPYNLSTSAPNAPEGWLRAVDEALIVTHLGVASADDSYEKAKAMLDALIGLHTDVATDPAVNGGFKLVPVEPTSAMLNAQEMLDGKTTYSDPLGPREAGEIYRAMLAAAPKPEVK